MQLELCVMMMIMQYIDWLNWSNNKNMIRHSLHRWWDLVYGCLYDIIEGLVPISSIINRNKQALKRKYQTTSEDLYETFKYKCK